MPILKRKERSLARNAIKNLNLALVKRGKNYIPREEVERFAEKYPELAKDRVRAHYWLDYYKQHEDAVDSELKGLKEKLKKMKEGTEEYESAKYRLFLLEELIKGADKLITREEERVRQADETLNAGPTLEQIKDINKMRRFNREVSKIDRYRHDVPRFLLRLTRRHLYPTHDAGMALEGPEGEREVMLRYTLKGRGRKKPYIEHINIRGGKYKELDLKPLIRPLTKTLGKRGYTFSIDDLNGEPWLITARKKDVNGEPIEQIKIENDGLVEVYKYAPDFTGRIKQITKSTDKMMKNLPKELGLKQYRMTLYREFRRNK